MNAKPYLVEIGENLTRVGLDAVLIGNAAAALQGAPVTTVDFDFMFRKTPGNLTKLRRVADDLGAVVMRPYYPASQWYRVVRDRDGLQLDFMPKVNGISRYESLRSRATTMKIGQGELRVAALEEVASPVAARPMARLA